MKMIYGDEKKHEYTDARFTWKAAICKFETDILHVYRFEPGI